MISALIIIITIVSIWLLIYFLENKNKIRESTRKFVNKNARKVIKSSAPVEEKDDGDTLILTKSDRVKIVSDKANPTN